MGVLERRFCFGVVFERDLRGWSYLLVQRLCELCEVDGYGCGG